MKADTSQLAATLLKRYHKNLNAVVQVLERESGQQISKAERELLIRMIVEAD